MKSDKMAEVKALVTEPIPNKVELLTFRPLSLSATPNPFVHVSLPLTTARVSPVMPRHCMRVSTNSCKSVVCSGVKTVPPAMGLLETRTRHSNVAWSTIVTLWGFYSCFFLLLQTNFALQNAGYLLQVMVTPLVTGPWLRLTQCRFSLLEVA